MEEITLEKINQEGILLEESALWNIKKLNAQPGRIYLTTKRIAFKKNANPFAGPLLKIFLKRQDTHFAQNLPIEKIKDITQESFGVNKNILAITLENDSVVKFSVKDFNQWKEKIITLKNL